MQCTALPARPAPLLRAHTSAAALIKKLTCNCGVSTVPSAVQWYTAFPANMLPPIGLHWQGDRHLPQRGDWSWFICYTNYRATACCKPAASKRGVSCSSALLYLYAMHLQSAQPRTNSLSISAQPQRCAEDPKSRRNPATLAVSAAVGAARRPRCMRLYDAGGCSMGRSTRRVQNLHVRSDGVSQH